MPSPKRARKKTIKQLSSESKIQISELKQQLAILELKSASTHSAARRQIVAIARDILPNAAALARRGRPRLLAVCAKIIGDPKMEAHLETVAKL